MQKIKITKIIEEMDLDKATNLCSQVLNKPENTSQKDWENQIKEDLILGKKSFRIREVVLSEKGPLQSPKSLL